MMIAQLVSWSPSTGRTVAHRVVVAVAFAGSLLLMLAWSWLYFTGNWAS